MKVYITSIQEMEIDLNNGGIASFEIENVINGIIGELELSNVISIDGNYIMGSVGAFLLKEKYGIECAAMEII